MSGSPSNAADLSAECRRRVQAAPGRPAEIDASELVRIDRDDPRAPLLLDIRPEDERAAEGAIPGTRVIPLDRLAQDFRADDPDCPVVAYCRKGVRSLDAARILRAIGVNYPLSLRGGVTGWRAAGGELV